jgi:hypothetical protein
MGGFHLRASRSKELSDDVSGKSGPREEQRDSCHSCASYTAQAIVHHAPLSGLDDTVAPCVWLTLDLTFRYAFRYVKIINVHTSIEF